MNDPNPSPLNAVLLQGCTLADIERIINKAIDERMAAFVEAIQDKPPVLIRRSEAAKMIGVSLPTLDAYGKCGILHPKHLGGRVFYAEEEIKHYIKKV